MLLHSRSLTLSEIARIRALGSSVNRGSLLLGFSDCKILIIERVGKSLEIDTQQGLYN